MRLKVLACAAAALALTSLATAANASQVIFSDLGPGHIYNSGIAYGVFAPSGLASGFTSAGSYDLTQIDLGLTWYPPVGGVAQATISLRKNSDGFLGASLGTWQVPVISESGNTNGLTTVSNISGVHLDAGDYWLMVEAPAATELLWHFNSVGASGPMSNSGQFPGTLAAFDLIGTPSAAPEPGAWAMMILGVAMLGGLLRRRRLGAAVV